MQQKLILGGTNQTEKSETKVTMVTVRETQQERAQQNSTSDAQRRGGRQQRQDNRNNRNNSNRNPVTECGLCSLIQGKKVPQDYISMDFNQRHQKVGDRPIFPNTCLPWMMLSMEERERVLEDNDIFCKLCLRIM